MLYSFLQSKGVFETLQGGAVIDIGSGDGSEGKVFEENGFDVTYIEKKNGLDATTYDYSSSTYNIAIAQNSLPFMGDKQLEVIRSIYKTLKAEGYFYGTVFGNKDPWAKDGIITPVDFNDLREYLVEIGFEIIWSSEEEGLGKKKDGSYKNWHILKFLCKK